MFTAISKKQSHVPFRNSKLTHLLQPSLSGLVPAHSTRPTPTQRHHSVSFLSSVQLLGLTCTAYSCVLTVRCGNIRERCHVQRECVLIYVWDGIFNRALAELSYGAFPFPACLLLFEQGTARLLF